MTQIGDKATLTEVVNSINLGPSGSLQFQFAKLQLAMSMLCKESALEYMAQIQNAQEEQKQIAQMLQGVRQAQANAKDGNNSVALSDDILAYMNANNLAVPAAANTGDITKMGAEVATLQSAYDIAKKNYNEAQAAWPASADEKTQSDYASKVDELYEKMMVAGYNLEEKKAAQAELKPVYSADNLDAAIISLQAHLDQIGSNTQQLMIYVQDFMGQYDSYLQGANSVIQSANQTLAQLARTN